MKYPKYGRDHEGFQKEGMIMCFIHILNDVLSVFVYYCDSIISICLWFPFNNAWIVKSTRLHRSITKDGLPLPWPSCVYSTGERPTENQRKASAKVPSSPSPRLKILLESWLHGNGPQHPKSCISDGMKSSCKEPPCKWFGPWCGAVVCLRTHHLSEEVRFKPSQDPKILQTVDVLHVSMLD